MIRLVEPDHPALQKGQGAGSPLVMAQIQAQAASAGGGILREFWVGEKGSQGEGRSWLCRSGDSLWATVSHPAAASQAAEFLRLLGGSLLQVDDAIMACLAPQGGLRRPVLAWTADGNLQGGTNPSGRGEHPLRPGEGLSASQGEDNRQKVGDCAQSPGLHLQIAPPGDASLVRTILKLHAQAGEVPRGERWDNLYAELHLRCRRQVAAGAVLWEGGRPVACGALGSIGASDAVVSHLCTLPENRRRGLAAQVTQALCWLATQLGRRPVLCCREELLPLYQGVGFVPSGQGHWIVRAPNATG